MFYSSTWVENKMSNAPGFRGVVTDLGGNVGGIASLHSTRELGGLSSEKGTYAAKYANVFSGAMLIARYLEIKCQLRLDFVR